MTRFSMMQRVIFAALVSFLLASSVTGKKLRAIKDNKEARNLLTYKHSGYGVTTKRMKEYFYDIYKMGEWDSEGKGKGAKGVKSKGTKDIKSKGKGKGVKGVGKSKGKEGKGGKGKGLGGKSKGNGKGAGNSKGNGGKGGNGSMPSLSPTTPPPTMLPTAGVSQLPPRCSCDDNDLCTIDTCNTTGQCIYTPVSCAVNESCDTFDGICKPNNNVRPCVAVIDESDNDPESYFDSKWLEFRTRFPNRPFCLLVPIDSFQGGLYTPEAFNQDPRTVQANVTRDDGVTADQSDWFSICGLDRLASTGIDYVGFFIDTSGSMTEDTVSASLDEFYRDLTAAGLNYSSVFNADEDWIDPFLVDLV